MNVIVVLKGFNCSFYDIDNKTKYGRILLTTAIAKFPIIEEMEVGSMYNVTLDAYELEHTRFDKGALEVIHIEISIKRIDTVCTVYDDRKSIEL